MSKSPVRINFEDGFFVGASGKKYVFLDSLPVDYWIEYQKLIPEVTYGVEFKTMYQTLRKSYDALTTGNEILKAQRIACDMLINQMSAIKNFTENTRHPSILKMAALWIVTEDEDLKKYDSRVRDAKIEDWRATGIAMDDFFLLCGQKIKSFKEIYLEFHQVAQGLEESPIAGMKS